MVTASQNKSNPRPNDFSKTLIIRRATLPLTTRIVLGLVAGAIVGFCLGELAQPLKALGDIYIGLMQMTILPFIVFSLIGNIGRLNRENLQLLARTGIVTYLILWLFAALTSLCFASLFPEVHSSHFFSSTLIEAPPTVDWFKLFVPSNPFRSLSDSAVPAIVIFCLFFGIGLTEIDAKRRLIELMSVSARSLINVNSMVVQLTPFGLFAITAYACGTITLKEFEQLEAYYLTIGGCTLVLTLIILPLLVCSFTRITYQDVLRISANSLLTAIVTGSILSGIPLLLEAIKSYYQKNHQDAEQNIEFAEFILPLAYPFPNSGNLTALLFVSFSAWFVGQPLSFGESVHLFWLGSFLMFGKVLLAIPFLLNLFQLPQDMFQLFIASGLFAGRLSDALGSMHYLVFTLIATARMTGHFEVRWPRLFKNLVMMMIATASLLALIRGPLNGLSAQDDTRPLILNRSNLFESKTTPLHVVPAVPNPIGLSGFKSRLDRIKHQGVMRVGFQEDYIPYSFLNSQGKPVGMDVDLLAKLAQELGVSLELVPYQRATQLKQMEHDHFDIAVSGISVTLERSEQMLLSEPYLIVNLALVVPDHRRNEFESEDLIKEMDHPHIAVLEGGLFEEGIRQHFPNAIIDRITTPSQFFEDTQTDYDVLAIHAESGSAWTLIHPEYALVNPFHHTDRAPLVMAISGRDLALKETIDTWIRLQGMNGQIDHLKEYWIEGKDAQNIPHRKPFLGLIAH